MEAAAVRPGKQPRITVGREQYLPALSSSSTGGILPKNPQILRLR